MKKLHYIVLLANFDPLTKEDLDFAMEKKKELDADGVYIMPLRRSLDTLIEKHNLDDVFVSGMISIQDYVNIVLKDSAIICMMEPRDEFPAVHDVLLNAIKSNKKANYNTKFFIYADTAFEHSAIHEHIGNKTNIIVKEFYDRSKFEKVLPHAHTYLNRMQPE